MQTGKYKIRPICCNNAKKNEETRNRIEKLCAENNIEIEKKTRITNNLYIYRVNVDTFEKYRLLNASEDIETLQKSVPAVLDINQTVER